jgi:hypothetical protein
MKTKNKIELIGFVGRDPETRQTTDGTPVTPSGAKRGSRKTVEESRRS